ncbi:LEAF RUST 10 DISEASE-RESISTANCE LOCUS RECEPTOR-LIKE PROTEIN KINASE-like 1.1 isoform X5 [Humulus lupulus]|uniref:LEAF RUST 10 DISEASE-RESISTANCE LOCUS RECEPTOR-LIKE PROTEIN KINASE-like 1.1 isoform X5 n=1 Tax=Humulus lupulus TaxID=3486 RepID=UPI002B40E97A|nr:LEAF RUST 10 DISEASE-RESISTANCE LOCUS RECEPTOR-LIKE PROTEIN KINASE-like 1.1 isoform X5 [Humulus lupulus]
MAPIPLFAFFFLITNSVLPSSAEESLPKCPSFLCGYDNKTQFSFINMMNPKCGVLTAKCSEDEPMIRLKEDGHWYRIENMSRSDSIISIVVKGAAPPFPLDTSKHCDYINKFSLPSPTWYEYNITAETSTNCSCTATNQTKCGDYHFSCNAVNMNASIKQQCPILPFSLPPPPPSPSPSPSPPPSLPYNSDPPHLHSTIEVQIRPGCFGCHFNEGGKCHSNFENHFQCIWPSKGLSKQQKLGLGLGIGFVVLFAMMGLAIIMWCRKQKRAASRNIDDPNMNMNMEDPEGASGYLGVLVFSYKELTEATNNFDADRELGDGGFGTVYHGKLKDGREVAVKRLYEHNYKRLEQFINEIQILAGLRHKNLVSLYGCTSRRSRELLLVYEYIPNGTVADHLHGDRAKTSPLTWPIRLSVAIETARALAYLHASDIVHRDVKTNNILLDNNFCVKVADFGLSRLFPSDVTHVSTAPQGTPGYVDPEYHQCYQLTSKSDVYSFGVVLVELLSSMPAVDITRHRHEINLSNLAISKIQKQAYNELIDQDLGFDSDTRVRTMTIAVAELAFECLQQDKEMRPTMDEVLERLMRIEDGKIETKVVGGSELSMSTVLPPPPSPECDEIGLLKNIKQEQPPSPNAVTENWLSSTSTTPNFSG